MNAQRLKNNIEKLFELAPGEGGGATRLAYSPEEARAMLFVASSNGVSHAPEEDVDREDLEQACKMLAALLPELERNYGGGRR